MENQVLELLKDSKALLEGHFLLSSGKHSNGYIQCAKLLQYPDKAEKVVEVIVAKLKESKVEVDLVVGPAMGGIVIAYEVGRQLKVPAIFTEREDNEMTLRRGFEILPNQKVLVVEDVVTTGKSSLETIAVIEAAQAEVVGIACLADRSGNGKLDYPLYAAIALDIQTYEAMDCPLCQSEMPLTKPGSRKKF